VCEQSSEKILEIKMEGAVRFWREMQMRSPKISLFLLNITRAIKTVVNRTDNIRVNVTLRRAHLTIVAEQKHGNSCVILDCHPWPVWLYHIFPHYLVNRTIFWKKVFDIKCVFWFSLWSLSEVVLILRRTRRHIFISAPTLSCKVAVILVRC
jgi:hypothetical protein